MGLTRLPPATSPPLAAYAFECDDEQKFVLSRVPGQPNAMDLVLGDRRQRLAYVRTGSGAQYAADGTSVWTKGGEAMLEVQGRVTTCRENRRRSILEDARARGVEFRASGNEPGWVWELLADRMIFIGAYGAERVTTSAICRFEQHDTRRNGLRRRRRGPPVDCARAAKAVRRHDER